MHRFFLILIAPLMLSKDLSGASFYQEAPPELAKSLQAQLPEVVHVLGGDPAILRETGAASKEDLAGAKFDFTHTARFHDIDDRQLDRASTLEDIVTPTNQYAVPICVRDQCKTMALVKWEPGAESATIRYVGRNVQQAAIQKAAERIADAPGDQPAKFVTPDILNLAYVPSADGGGYLVSATPEQESDLAALIDRSIPEKAGPWKMHLEDYKAIAETRAEQHTASHLDDFRRPEVAEDEPVGEKPAVATAGKELMAASATVSADPVIVEQPSDAVPNPSPSGRFGPLWVWIALALVLAMAVLLRKSRLYAP